MTEGDKQLLFN